jgi:hypothetical protein
MQTSRKLVNALIAVAALVMMSVSALAADPGDAYPAASELSDQKAGSILVYPVYTSSTANPAAQNTVMSITNTSSSSAVFVHLFFIANSCSVADRFICLTAQQTSTIDAFADDPGITGYVIAIASDGVNGCPNSHNFLIGDEYVKFSDGYFGSLGAEAFSALYQGSLPGCDANSTFADLFFNGAAGGYNRAGRVLAISSLGSRLDNTFHRVVLDSLRGDLFASVNDIGSLFIILYDEAEASYSSTLSAGCQLIGVLGDANFPRTTPRFERIIPANSTGWLKLWATTDRPIIGAVFTRNPNSATARANRGWDTESVERSRKVEGDGKRAFLTSPAVSL